MKISIKENWFKIFIILVIAGLFYWFYYRPSHIINKCSFEAKENAIIKLNNNGKFNAEDRDYYYKWCLQENGLNS